MEITKRHHNPDARNIIDCLVQHRLADHARPDDEAAAGTEASDKSPLLSLFLAAGTGLADS